MFARWFYTLIFYLLTPLIVLRLWWRARKASAYGKRWGERFGFVPVTASPVIWVHSVSVGETLAAVPLIKALQARYPDTRVAVTTMTPTGSERVRAVFGDTVYHCYAPYDLPDVLKRFLQRVRPRLLIIMETELWPNTIHACCKRDIPVILANARLSQKSADSYYRARWLASPMVQELSAVAAQTQADAERFQYLGATPERVSVSGNIKFDLDITAAQRAQARELRTGWRGTETRPVFLAASTHSGEDEIVLDAFEILRRSLPGVLLVLVPRHPERFNEVAELCLGRGFTLHRHSAQRANPAESGGSELSAAIDIVLGDTMGELLTFCGASDLVFVGGSLVPVGGHNVIEPAAWARPVLSGPHVFNFVEATHLLLEAGGMAICDSAEALAEAAAELLAEVPENQLENLSRDLSKNRPHNPLHNPPQNFSYNNKYQKMSRAALAVTEANRGALDRLLAIIESHVPR